MTTPKDAQCERYWIGYLDAILQADDLLQQLWHRDDHDKFTVCECRNAVLALRLFPQSAGSDALWRDFSLNGVH